MGQLIWLVSQLRWDLGRDLTILHAEMKAPTIRSLLLANSIVAPAKQDPDFAFRFRALDLEQAGIIAIGDEALGGLNEEGGDKGDSKPYSTGAYLVAMADQSLLKGGKGIMNPLDSKVYRIKRACRSSYAAETLNFEDMVDSAQLLRGYMAELRNLDVSGPRLDKAVDQIPFLAVTDAEDTHDKVGSETTTGSQKSL